MLRTIKLGEADRIVTILTQGHGKVRAVAKGVRKTTSRFGARLEPTSHVALQCYQGPRARHRHPGRDDRPLPAAPRGLRRCSPTRSRCSRPSTRSPRSASRTRALYRMLVGALRTLAEHAAARSSRPRSSGSCSSLEGFHPHARRLRALRRRDRRRSSAFDLDEGGVLCRACARGGGRPVTPEALDAAAARSSAAGSTACSPSRPAPATHEVERLGVRALEHHIERRLRSRRAALTPGVPALGSGTERRGRRRPRLAIAPHGRRPT